MPDPNQIRREKAERDARKHPEKAAAQVHHLEERLLENDRKPSEWFDVEQVHAELAGLLEGLKGSGHCRDCGRKLEVPESIERGIGPDCWARREVERIQAEEKAAGVSTGDRDADYVAAAVKTPVAQMVAEDLLPGDVITYDAQALIARGLPGDERVLEVDFTDEGRIRIRTRHRVLELADSQTLAVRKVGDRGRYTTTVNVSPSAGL